MIMKEKNIPFYNIGNGVGVEIDGTIGGEFWRKELDDGGVMQSLRLYALDHKQEVGYRGEDNPLMTDGAFIELCFGSPKSVDIVIEWLELLKQEFK